jgi:hypothetical protein
MSSHLKDLKPMMYCTFPLVLEAVAQRRGGQRLCEEAGKDLLILHWPRCVAWLLGGHTRGVPAACFGPVCGSGAA